MERKTVHFMSYTHWDREFRFDFETTRIWLVRLIDDLLKIMREKPDFKYYMFDGQFTLIDDYLEVRPEKTDEIYELARQGRLGLGPWYTLPDSSSIHGESLLRNIMLGQRRCEEVGAAPVGVGYNVFSFGQIGQLPQVYAGFGIDFIMFYKHMDKTRVKDDEFWWESPDGTRAMASHLGREARWNFFFAGHIPIMYGLDPWHKDWQYEWGRLGASFHLCEPENYASFHFITAPKDDWHPEKVKEGIERLLSTVTTTAAPEHLLAFDGTDFTAPHPMIPEVIAKANEIFGDEYEFIHSTLDDYVKAVRPLLEQRDLDTAVGEMKDGPVGAIHTDVCSTHQELKRANSQAENVLFRQGEPMASVAWTLGRTYPKFLLEKGHRLLFSAQAHDSLHGVGPADMNKDIQNHLLQAKVIGENVAVSSMQEIAMEINTASMDGEFFLTVFNAAGFERTEVLEAYLDLPRDVMIESVILEDENGNAADIYQLEVLDKRGGLYHPRSRNMPFYSQRYHLLFEASDVPAVGYKVYKISWKEKALYPYPHEDWDPIMIPAAPLADSPLTAANEFVAVEINHDGTFSLTDKATGEKYENMNYYIDGGESGTLYTYQPPVHDKIITTLGQPAKIALVENNPLRATFEIKTIMTVPSCYVKADKSRSDIDVELPITTRVTLKKSSPAVEVEVTVNNTARDHYLRVCFPTGIQAEKTFAGSVFDVNSYDTRIPADGKWAGQALSRHQQHLFMDISDGQNGLAILNDTLRDYEVIDADKGLIAHTLLRSMPVRIPVDNRLWMEYPGDDSAQTLGEHVIKYSLMPHAGSWDESGVMKKALANVTPMRCAEIGSQEATLATSRSFIELGGSDNLVLNAVKKAESRDTLIVRFYNPSTEDVTAVLNTSWNVEAAWKTQLNEQRIEELEVADNTISINAGPHKIITVELALK